jgi:hypothetical protein
MFESAWEGATKPAVHVCTIGPVYAARPYGCKVSARRLAYPMRMTRESAGWR